MFSSFFWLINIRTYGHNNISLTVGGYVQGRSGLNMYLRTNQRWDDKQKGEQVTIDSTILCSNTNNISYENLIARRGKARLVIIIITRLKGPRLATYVRYLFLNISNAPSFLFVIIDSLNKNIIRFHVFAWNKISKIKKIPKLRKSSRIYVPEEKTKMLVWDFFRSYY